MPHIHEKIDFTVEVFVVFKNKVLLRLHDKYHVWLSVGGHVELDEDPNETAVREIWEEVGLKIKLCNILKPKIKPKDGYKELIPPFFMNRHKINETHKHISLTYFATTKSELITQREVGKITNCKWFTKEEIEKNDDINPAIKYYALKALSLIKNK